MIDIGGRPLLWHVMKNYAAYDITDFVICCGYKGYMIKEFFCQQRSLQARATSPSTWRAGSHASSTAATSSRGGSPLSIRVSTPRPVAASAWVASHLVDEETFCFTYGDGVADVDITGLVSFHRHHGLNATCDGGTAAGAFRVAQRRR